MDHADDSPLIGFLYPGHSAEDDYPVFQEKLGGAAELRVVHTRMREDAHRLDALLDIGGPEILADGARHVRGARAVVWACTSGSFVFGWSGAEEQVRGVSEAAGAPASSTSFAFVHAVRRLGLRSVAVAATYPQDVAHRFVEFLAMGGVEVASLSSRGIVTAAEVGRLSGEEVLDFAAENDHPDAEGLLIPDTALHSAAVLDSLEGRLAKPVLTANQVSVWEGLRLAGALRRTSGLGSLFEVAVPASH
jgi:maleate cis-trans isomerase